MTLLEMTVKGLELGFTEHELKRKKDWIVSGWQHWLAVMVCRHWLSTMIANDGCQQWMSAMVVNNGCQQWLSALVVSNDRQQWL